MKFSAVSMVASIMCFMILSFITPSHAFSQPNVADSKRPSFKIFSLGDECEIRLQPSPLIGGPSWLPVHVKLILRSKERCDDYVCDFVPLNATDSQVLSRLTRFQSVPGLIRTKSMDQRSINLVVQEAQNYCESYPRELNLVTNNCWTFVIRLTMHLLSVQQKR